LNFKHNTQKSAKTWSHKDQKFNSALETGTSISHFITTWYRETSLTCESNWRHDVRTIRYGSPARYSSNACVCCMAYFFLQRM